MRRVIVWASIAAVLFALSFLLAPSQPHGHDNGIGVNDVDSAMAPPAPPTTAGTRPLARGYHGMAYDSESDSVVLFGGWSGGENGETWTYNLNTNTWAKRNPSTSPSPRDSHAMTYDAQSDLVILFGGYTDAGPTGETWAYNLNTDTWTNMGPATSPSARYAARMAYDAAADRVILFGGEDGVGGFFGDTWSYDYNSNTWTPLTTVGAPSPRGFQAMGYDAESNLVIMFGGNGAPIHGDTWTFDTGTATWSEVTSATTPSQRGWCGGTYDAGSDRFFIFGGSSGPDETWAYNANANAWVRVDASPRPSQRHEHAMAYDSESDRVVLFGGMWPVGLVTDPTIVRNRETWILDGKNGTWTLVDGPEGPVASFMFSPSSPTPDDSVTFNAASSSDPDGTLVAYAWDFGDGGKANGATVQHAFLAPGTYTVTLTVTDDDRLTASEAQQVIIGPGPDTQDPSVTISSPVSGAVLASTTVTVTGTASDNVAVEKVELSMDGTTWTLATGTTSWSGTLTLAEGANTIRARATDPSGNMATTSISVTVPPPPPPPSPPPLILIGGAIAAVSAAAAVLALFMRKRRRGGS